MPKYGAVKYGAAQYGSEYLTAIAANARTTRISGKITLADATEIAIYSGLIQSGSLSLSEQCVSGENLEIGNVFASELNVAILNPTGVLVNLITNGSFIGTTGWTAAYATIAASINELYMTGDGGGATPFVYAPLLVINGHKYYCRIRVRVYNNVCTKIRLFTNMGWEVAVANPVQNQWYDLSGVFTLTTDSFLEIGHDYADAATANGKIMGTKFVSTIDLTAAFGAGNEPTAAVMDTYLARLPNNWFNDIAGFTEFATVGFTNWDFTNAVARINFDLLVGTDYESILLGVFNVVDAPSNTISTVLTALDNMILLDKDLGATDTTAETCEGLITKACATAGVTLATSHATFETYPNKTLSLTLPAESAVKTCRDLIMWACQINATFARMNRAGALEILSLHSTSVRSITGTERYSPTIVSDLAIKITGLDMKIGETLYTVGTTALMLVLDGNPLLETQEVAAITTAMNNILADITQAEYTPFDISFIGDPTLQAGNYVTLEDTTGADPVGLITHSTWRYRGKHSLKSVGKSGLISTSINQNKKKLTSLTADVAHIVDLIITGRITVGSETTFSAGYDPITKRTVFTAQPVPPYRVGDLWLTSLTDFEGDMKKCIYQRLAGAYDAAHWVVALGPVEFAKLGTTIIEDGWIITDLLTADNIMAGNLVVGGSGHVGSISVLNAIGEQIATIDHNGINVNALVGATGFTGNNGMAAVTMEFTDAYCQMQLSQLYEDFYEPILFKAQHVRASYDTNGTTYWSTDATYLDIGNSLGGGIYEVHILDALYIRNAEVFVNIGGTEIMNLTDTGASFFGVPVVTSWAVAAWAPTLGGITIGNGAVIARSKQLGVLSYFEFTLTFGSTTSVTGSVTFTLPSTAKSSRMLYGSILDSGTRYHFSVGQLTAASNVCYVYVLNSSGVYLELSTLSSTVPMTWTTGDAIFMSGWYEH